MGSLVNKDFKATHIWVCLKSNEGAPEIQKGLVSSFDLNLTDPMCSIQNSCQLLWQVVSKGVVSFENCVFFSLPIMWVYQMPTT